MLDALKSTSCSPAERQPWTQSSCKCSCVTVNSPVFKGKQSCALKLSSVVLWGAQMPVQAAVCCDCVSRVSVIVRLLSLLLSFTVRHFFSLLPAAPGLHFWALPTSSLLFPSAAWKSLMIR